ncbi:MAG: hypothetical protein ABIR79_10980 [Candidatus Binatia bacterium]
MKLGRYLRNMGPQSTRATIVACARAAEAAGVDELWLADHIAIPPIQRGSAPQARSGLRER